MTADMTPAQRRAAIARTNSAALAETATILREVAQHDNHVEVAVPRRRRRSPARIVPCGN